MTFTVAEQTVQYISEAISIKYTVKTNRTAVLFIVVVMNFKGVFSVLQVRVR